MVAGVGSEACPMIGEGEMVVGQDGLCHQAPHHLTQLPTHPSAVGLQGESVGRAVAVGLIAAVVGGGLVLWAALVHLELNCLDTYTVKTFKIMRS